MNEIELFLLHFKKDKLLTVLSIEISEIIKTREMMAHQIWYKKCVLHHNFKHIHHMKNLYA